MNKNWAIALGVVAVVALWAVGTYNSLVGRQEAVNGAWAQVQNVYQRRADLVPNLVQTVKGAARFEKSTLTEITEARARVGSVQADASTLSDPAKFKDFAAAQDRLGGALSRLLVVVERYPELKANANFRDLQVQLEGTENRIAVERRDFNAMVIGYNAAIRKLPAALIAGIGGFKARPYFEAEAGAASAPKVDFSDK